ncbi:MAG: hypothetical protein U5O39_02605 [Gammaproteobacteria bacterium]|nr:hypothetical protein [Gammaproteobacteria bacterium]
MTAAAAAGVNMINDVRALASQTVLSRRRRVVDCLCA